MAAGEEMVTRKRRSDYQEEKNDDSEMIAAENPNHESSKYCSSDEKRVSDNARSSFASDASGRVLFQDCTYNASLAVKRMKTVKVNENASEKMFEKE
jgi:hypothetical protein